MNLQGKAGAMTHLLPGQIDSKGQNRHLSQNQ